MSSISLILRVFAILIVLGVIGFAKWGVPHWLKKKGIVERPSLPLEQLINDQDELGFEPGQREFTKALELIALDRMEEAIENLSLIQKLYPKSSIGPEAIRILGEINLDRILAIDNSTNKTIHKVKPGEGYLNIVQAHNTTLECLMALNGLLDTSALHVGDEFLVMPLNFKVLIDIPRQRVVLLEKRSTNQQYTFAKEYLIQRADVGTLRGNSLSTTIARKHGEWLSRSYHPGQALYRHAVKVLGFDLQGRSLQIRPVPAADAEDPGRGLFLTTPDMEELAMLVRIGNEVEVRAGG